MGNIAVRRLPRNRPSAPRGRLLLVLLFLALILVAVPAPLARADTTITVTSTAGDTGGPACRLRDAITAANSGVTTGGCVLPLNSTPPYTIVLKKATYTLSVVDNENYGPNGLPVIMTQIVIEGNGATIKRVSTAPRFRIFMVGLESGMPYPYEPSELTLNNVTVTGGWTPDDSYYNGGGGIFVSYYGELTVNDSKITANKTGNSTANERAADLLGDGYGGGEGGGIFNDGLMWLNNTTVSNNITGDGIVGFGGDGGGIHSRGSMWLTKSTVSGNRTGSGLYEGGYGAGIYTEGGVAAQGSRATPPAKLNTDKCWGACLFETVVSNNIAGSGGYIGGWGGGIANWYSELMLVNSTVSGNRSGDGTSSGEESGTGGFGGGIANNGYCYYYDGGAYCYGVANVVNSTVSGNVTGRSPGNGRPGGYGGGILNFGQIYLLGSTVSGNVTGTNADRAGGPGGGLANGGYFNVANSTFSGNRVGGVAMGGAIYTDTSSADSMLDSLSRERLSKHRRPSEKTLAPQDQTLGQGNEYGGYIYYSTLSGNTASQGGGIFVGTGQVGLETTIVAKNPAGGDCAIGSELGMGIVVDEGYNLDSDNSCGLSSANNSKPGSNPLFSGLLKNNGGPTKTIALSARSPAVDAIPGEMCGEMGADQRGLPRPQGSGCDMGAYEYAATGQLPVFTKTATVLQNGGSILYTITLRNTTGNTLKNVIVTDPIDPATTVIFSSTTRGTCTGKETVVCAPGDVAPGQTVTIYIQVLVIQDVPSVTNTATMDARQNGAPIEMEWTVVVQLDGRLPPARP